MERKELLLVLMIGVLMLTTAMQTVALTSLRGAAVTGGVVAVSPSSSQTPAPSSGQSGQLANLPSMVGGC